jgi:hypothetical protein
MRLLLAIIAPLLVTACAESLTGNERGGIISNHGWSPKRSFAMAEAHCQKYGRHARSTGTNDLEAIMRFDCVE